VLLRHRKTVGLFWVVVGVIGIALVGSITGRFSSTTTLPGLPSYRASQAVVHTYGNGGNNNATVAVVTLPAGQRVNTPAGLAQTRLSWSARPGRGTDPSDRRPVLLEVTESGRRTGAKAFSGVIVGTQRVNDQRRGARPAEARLGPRSTENMLIQATTPGATYGADPAMRHAAPQVAAALVALPKHAAHIQARACRRRGHCALVTFQVPGNVTNIDQAVTCLQRAVAGVQARYPDLRVAETSNASIQQAINSCHTMEEQ
jgi:hypothetical protein